jgi:transcriptional regulator with XRE-family HTH domain
MPRGRPPNLERGRQLAVLVAQGLSQSEVAERLGVTKHAVSNFLRRRRRRPTDFRVRCRDCGLDLSPAAARTEVDRKAYCPACLEGHPEASFAAHLKCYRLAGGLSQAAPAARAGMVRTVVSAMGRGAADPSWKNAAKLLRALGVWFVVRTGKAVNTNETFSP